MWYGWRDGCRREETEEEAWDGLEAGGLVSTSLPVRGDEVVSAPTEQIHSRASDRSKVSLSDQYPQSKLIESLFFLHHHKHAAVYSVLRVESFYLDSLRDEHVVCYYVNVGERK